ncbi:hypothetical protein ABZX85_48690 [Streptomyces sp. NPDC004539]|uniref:hypothetical protein n=1 Tax=Streptomyces sp. NPDC004539 TaxID=3154280 RepID=UPI0033BC6612
MRNEPHRITVNGRPMVALSTRQFETLCAMRRQLGGQSARMRIMRDTLTDLGEFLDGLAETLDAADPRVTEIRRRAHQARSGTGRSTP